MEEERGSGLVAEGALVEDVAKDAEGEDCYGEAVAGMERVAARELGEGLVVVLWGAED